MSTTFWNGRVVVSLNRSVPCDMLKSIANPSVWEENDATAAGLPAVAAAAWACWAGRYELLIESVTPSAAAAVRMRTKASAASRCSCCPRAPGIGVSAALMRDCIAASNSARVTAACGPELARRSGRSRVSDANI
jgi:hypothetical protein